jgi:hypothetical protein
VEAGDGVVLVEFSRKKRCQLELAQICFEVIQSLGQLASNLAVSAFLEKLIEDLKLFEAFGEVSVSGEVLTEAGESGGQLLATTGIVPESRFGQSPLERLRLPPFPVDVKGTPSRWRAWRRCPRYVP